MLRSRIIPCLLLHNNLLYKTVQFGNPKYIGDPINAVKIFNEKEVDELMIFDIDASTLNMEPNYSLLERLSYECRIPLCYGGGIKSVAQAKKIIKLGAEKISVSSSLFKNFDILRDLSNEIGVQSVIVTLDVKKNKNLFKTNYDVFTKNGKVKIDITFETILDIINQGFVGELVINSIDSDGCMSGYDTHLVEIVRKHVDIPITVLGGASSLDDISNLIYKFKLIGASAGSLFVFKGKYKAVLINYPSFNERLKIY